MRFGLFGSASARRGGAEFDSSEGFRDFIDYNVEAEALGFHSTFVVEHHFTGYGQVSATLNLLTWVGARTRRLRLGTAVMVLPWHNPVLLAEQAAALDPPGRRPRVQPAPRAIRVAHERGLAHRRLQVRGGGSWPPLRPDAGRGHPRVFRDRRRRGTRGGPGAPAAESGPPAEARHLARRHGARRPGPGHRP